MMLSSVMNALDCAVKKSAIASHAIGTPQRPQKLRPKNRLMGEPDGRSGSVAASVSTVGSDILDLFSGRCANNLAFTDRTRVHFANYAPTLQNQDSIGDVHEFG